MPDSRKARRQNDPGLQPERTSLALVSHAAGIRGVNGVSRQAPLASGGIPVLGVNQRSGDSGGDSLALYPES